MEYDRALHYHMREKVAVTEDIMVRYVLSMTFKKRSLFFFTGARRESSQWLPFLQNLREGDVQV